jgi:hypothetical protein
MRRGSLVVALGLCAALAPAEEARGLKDHTKVKPAGLKLKWVEPTKDEKTGFVVGGKNPTGLIRKLTHLNGKTIAELEKAMRPGALSRAGFLGNDEKLLDVMAADNEYVVDKLGLTHQELARHLRVLATKGGEKAFVYHGRRFRVGIVGFFGFQASPFADGTRASREATVYNLDNGKKLWYSLLVPDMVERYGFYEGKGTKYRVDPKAILEVLDFLKPKGEGGGVKGRGLKSVEPKKDPKTGFVVGGKNSTALIRKLPHLNGKTIAELEKAMRPGALSRAGFLGKDEKLLDVLAADNELVVDRLGLTHQELARHLQALAAKGGERPVLYHGRRFQVRRVETDGYQESPFADGTRGSTDVTLRNLDNGKTLSYSLLVPDMIERYGFYEGKGTPYRVDPKKALEVLDFIKPKSKLPTP